MCIEVFVLFIINGICVFIRVVSISLFIKLILKFIIYWYGGLEFIVGLLK